MRKDNQVLIKYNYCYRDGSNWSIFDVHRIIKTLLVISQRCPIKANATLEYTVY